MGVVVRQGLKYMMVSYTFTIVSIIASLFIYPLEKDLYGTFVFVKSTAFLIAPWLVFGMTNVILKFYPEVYQRNNSGNLLFTTGLIVIGASSLILFVLMYLNQESLKHFLSTKSKAMDLGQAYWLFLPMCILSAVHLLYIPVLSNLRRTAFPIFVESVYRISLPVVFLLVYGGYISPLTGLVLLVLHYVFSNSVLTYLLNKLDRIRRQSWKDVRSLLSRSDVQSYALYGVLSAVGAVWSLQIDKFMVTTMLDTEYNGIYSIGGNIGNLIAVPTAAIVSITAPLISSAMQNSELSTVTDLYRRSSSVLTLAGCILLAGLCVIIDDLLVIMPNSESLIENDIYYVIFFIACAQFINMLTSVDTHIISFSKYYKFNLIFLVSLSIVNILLNLLLIPVWGIKGAAFATMCSMAIYNMSKTFFIYSKFSIWPFSFRTLFMILLSSVAVLLVRWMSGLWHIGAECSLILNGTIVTVLIFGSVYFLHLVPDVNDNVQRLLKKYLS